MNYAKKIDELRLKKGWSLCKLAKEAGLADNTVYNWYNEKKLQPSLYAIEAICSVLNITLAEFFTDAELDKLSPKTLKMIDMFEPLSKTKKDAILAIISTYSKESD